MGGDSNTKTNHNYTQYPLTFKRRQNKLYITHHTILSKLKDLEKKDYSSISKPPELESSSLSEPPPEPDCGGLGPPPPHLLLIKSSNLCNPASTLPSNLWNPEIRHPLCPPAIAFVIKFSWRYPCSQCHPSQALSCQSLQCQPSSSYHEHSPSCLLLLSPSRQHLQPPWRWKVTARPLRLQKKNSKHSKYNSFQMKPKQQLQKKKKMRFTRLPLFFFTSS